MSNLIECSLCDGTGKFEGWDEKDTCPCCKGDKYITVEEQKEFDEWYEKHHGSGNPEPEDLE
jgi:DnaJ-class molecular chaperone